MKGRRGRRGGGVRTGGRAEAFPVWEDAKRAEQDRVNDQALVELQQPAPSACAGVDGGGLYRGTK